jgi:hypothetical protein
MNRREDGTAQLRLRRWVSLLIGGACITQARRASAGAPKARGRRWRRASGAALDLLRQDSATDGASGWRKRAERAKQASGIAL